MWQRVKNLYHLFVAVLANIYYNLPAKKLTVIGVTGTDGKTTTTNLIYHILKSSGKSVSMISTVSAVINGKTFDTGFHVTTPSSFAIQKFLKKISETGKTTKNYLVLEVSSHSLDQNRIWGIPFTYGVLTNITHEHLDYHKKIENYAKTKLKLLQSAKVSVLNKDDSSYTFVRNRLRKNKPLITYGLTAADVTPEKFPFKTSLIGQYNTYNILAAIAVCKAIGISQVKIVAAIETFILPLGRMDEIPNKKGIRIFIDYAHTPNGLHNALLALQSLKPRRIIAIIGAEGKRDPSKRPLMGKEAIKHADYVVVTAVDPRGDIDGINQQILKGAQKVGKMVKKRMFIEDDREKAIRFAIDLAREGDIVGIFGKGHEKSQNLDGKKEIPWSDHKAVEKALK